MFSRKFPATANATKKTQKTSWETEGVVNIIKQVNHFDIKFRLDKALDQRCGKNIIDEKCVKVSAHKGDLIKMHPFIVELVCLEMDGLLDTAGQYR